MASPPESPERRAVSLAQRWGIRKRARGRQRTPRSASHRPHADWRHKLGQCVRAPDGAAALRALLASSPRARHAINKRDTSRRTLLHAAAAADATDVVRLLLDYDRGPERVAFGLTDDAGATPYDLAPPGPTRALFERRRADIRGSAPVRAAAPPVFCFEDSDGDTDHSHDVDSSVECDPVAVHSSGSASPPPAHAPPPPPPCLSPDEAACASRLVCPDATAGVHAAVGAAVAELLT